MDDLQVIVLAAGKGTRMPSDLPKMLRPLAGEPLVRHVLRRAQSLVPARILLVLGHRAEEIRQAIADEPVEIVLQEVQRGTGDAVLRAESHAGASAGNTLILYGDVPLLRQRTLQELLELHEIEGNAATILTAVLEDATGYGRIIRDERGCCSGIVEQCDLEAPQAEIREINSGIVVFRSELLFEALHQVRPQNVKGEYYLTDAIAILRGDDRRVGCYSLRDSGEILGVNTLEQLQEVERILQRRCRAGACECDLCEAGAAEGAAGSAALLLASGERVRLQVAARPFNSGHLVLFPTRHITSFPSLDREEQKEIRRFLRLGEEILRKVYRFEGLNIGYNSGAGEHLALHLIPRWSGDLNYLPLLADLKLVPESPERTWERLQEVIQ
jgi:CTP:molybdopterin cytidylyltransferase MocA/diadenosine tetraphosphate (Ap4A) HIT family hydrolase